MASLLIVSADPDSISRIETIAKTLGLRTRAVTSIEDAQKWLAMQTYQVLLADSRFEGNSALQLIEEAWKLNPLLIGGLFNFHGSVESAPLASVLGVRVFAGETGLSRVEQLLKNLPEKFTLGEDYSILVVEDLDSPRDIICSYVETLGYPKVIGANGAKDALAKLKQNPQSFLAVLTDINMPQVNGIELIKSIRAGNQTAHLPIIVLTAYATPDKLLECIHAGATGFLVKPPRKNSLRQELERARRIMLTGESPWLCDPKNAKALDAALEKYLR